MRHLFRILVMKQSCWMLVSISAEPNFQGTKTMESDHLLPGSELKVCSVSKSS